MTHNRRALLTVAGASLLSGCSVLGSLNEPPDADGDGVPDKDDDYPNNPDRRLQQATDSAVIEISPGDDQHNQLWIQVGPGYLDLSVAVREGPAVNVMVFSPEDYQKYRGREDGRPIAEFRQEGVREIEEVVNDRTIDGAAFHTVIENPHQAQRSTVEYEYEVFK